jgi:hypothetical protein
VPEGNKTLACETRHRCSDALNDIWHGREAGATCASSQPLPAPVRHVGMWQRLRHCATRWKVAGSIPVEVSGPAVDSAS